MLGLMNVQIMCVFSGVFLRECVCVHGVCLFLRVRQCILWLFGCVRGGGPCVCISGLFGPCVA